MNDVPESKLKEGLIFLGYSIMVVGGMIALGLVYLFIEPIIAFIQSIIFIIAAIGFIITLLAAGVYLLFFRKKMK